MGAQLGFGGGGASGRRGARTGRGRRTITGRRRAEEMVCGMTDYELLAVVRRAVLDAGVKHGVGAEEATDIVACVDELLRGELGTRCP